MQGKREEQGTTTFGNGCGVRGELSGGLYGRARDIENDAGRCGSFVCD